MRVSASDGAALFVADEGPRDGPSVVFLHSIGCDHAMWADQARAVGRWRTIRPDIRGHGRSAAPPGDYALDRLADDVLEVLAALDVRQAIVCGLSLGGLVAQAVALRTPSAVRGLVLANTAARIGAPDAWAERAAWVRAEGLAGIADMAMGRFFSEEFRAEHPATVARFRQTLIGGSAEGYAGCCAALAGADLTADVGAIAAPTLVIGGARDLSTPPEQTAALAAAIPGARYVELDAAHLSNVERPESFSAALVKHLETC
jgi:3-oxoadipate enol-lactonase